MSGIEPRTWVKDIVEEELRKNWNEGREKGIKVEIDEVKKEKWGTRKKGKRVNDK
jgi:hypothetical protein